MFCVSSSPIGYFHYWTVCHKKFFRSTETAVSVSLQAAFIPSLERHGEFCLSLKGLTICYIGDGENNVTHSLCLVSALLGVNFISASPPGFGMNSKIMEKAQLIAAKNKSWIKQIISPQEAVNNADVVVTDTWISMGDEDEKANRIAIFQPYQVNNKLMSAAKKDALFMHCLPAYRDHEVASEVIDGPQSVVIQEAENRLHAQKALMCYLLHKIN